MSDTTDLYPVEVTIRNLYCYRGEHTFKLGPNVYAVIAEADDNPKRSNWLGKSTLLMAFAFALVGWHTKKTDDEIVTIGEDEALVRLTLNDGSVIERSKRRGKSVQIKFTPPGEKTLAQESAIKRLEVHTGLNDENFFEILFFRQGKIGAFVTGGAAGRLDMVEGWLSQELEPVQRLFAAASGHFTGVRQAIDQLKHEREQLKHDLIALLTKYSETPEPDQELDLAGELDDRVEELKQTRAELNEALVAGVALAQEYKRIDELKARAQEYDETVASGVEAKQALAEIPEEVDTLATVAEADLINLRKRKEEANEQWRVLKRNEFAFDGKCPVVCAQCPSSVWVSKQASEPKMVKRAEQTLTELTEQHRQQTHKVVDLKAKVKLKADLQLEIAELRATALALADDAERADAIPETHMRQHFDEAAVRAEIDDITQDIRDVEAERTRYAEMNDRFLEIEEELRTQATRLQIAQDALATVGKSGAQRAIQELMLVKVEREANAILTEAAIPLQVEVKWDHDAKGLAKVCGECGTAFPTSQRVKECGACGAERGPNITQKLRVQLSNESGAAEDLAGIAMGVAASNWLRAHRGVRWSCVFIDEPFGKLDQHNRQALGVHIAAMLARSFDCALVVAHELATLLAMPGRITIKAGPEGSRVHEVQ